MCRNGQAERPMVTIRIPQEIYDALTNLAVRAEDVIHTVSMIEHAVFDLRNSLLKIFHE